MTLNFLGNGSGFSDTHNNAYFTIGNDIIFLDLSMLNIFKAKELIEQYKGEIYILVTHMHDDHFSGIPLFAQHCYYVKSRIPNLLYPSNLERDILTEFKIKGVNHDVVTLINLFYNHFPWLKNIIPTTHAEELRGKTYGYCLEVDSKNIVYTGDTNTITPFIPYFKDNSEIYIDVSYSYGKVHLLWDDVKDKLIELAKTNEVYLMHIDDSENLAKAIIGTNIKIAEITA